MKISRINPFIDTKLDISIRYTPYLVVLGSNKKVKTREIFAAQFAYTSWHLQIVQDRSVPLGLKGGDWGSLAQSADLMVSRCIQTGYFVETVASIIFYVSTPTSKLNIKRTLPLFFSKPMIIKPKPALPGSRYYYQSSETTQAKR